MNELSQLQKAERGTRLRTALGALASQMTLVNHRVVAAKAGVPRQVLSELVHGKRDLTPYYAEKLAPVLGVPVGYLLGLDEPAGDAA